MSEPILERLSRFTPDAGGLDRDALLFAAGRNSARPNRAWASVASLLAATQALSLALLWPRPNLPADRSTRSLVAVPMPPGALEHPSLSAFPGPPHVLSARQSLREPDLDIRPEPDVTFVDQGPPLRAFAPLPPALLN